MKYDIETIRCWSRAGNVTSPETALEMCDEMEQLSLKLDLAVKTFGQLKTIVDDCQHMSRFAANKFDEIIDHALAKIKE